jgi:integrase
MATGIETRADSKGRKRYRGVVNSKATGKRNGPWGTFSEAKSWRSKALGEIEAGTVGRSEPITLRDEWEAFIAGAEAGTIHDRTGKPYKPATLRGYTRGWAKIDPELGAHRLTDIRRRDIQALVDRWAVAGDMSASTIRNTLDPLRAIYRRALARDRVAINPTVSLDVPRVVNGRERFATKAEAAALLAALPETEQTLWATAVYGGLRRGELRALRWSDVDLKASVINVRRSWDDDEGEQEPKTKGSTRRVPIVPRLARLLRAHAKTTGRSGDDLVFGRSASDPFIPSTTRARALKAWKAQDPALNPIGLHECRHTFASLMIAAGCNAKALSVVMGHASIQITFDRYGKLMPGGEAEVGRLLSAYLNGGG